MECPPSLNLLLELEPPTRENCSLVLQLIDQDRFDIVTTNLGVSTYVQQKRCISHSEAFIPKKASINNGYSMYVGLMRDSNLVYFRTDINLRLKPNSRNGNFV